MREITLVEYKERIATVLSIIDKLCRENDIRYSLGFGTLLGAIRHQGFIPWDDDIDIMMPYSDYDKLADIINSGDYGINMIRIEENPDAYCPFGKVCDTNTIVKEGSCEYIEGYGAYVDVFPVAKIPNSFFWRFYKHWFLLVRLAFYSKKQKPSKTDSFMRNLLRWAEFLISRFVNTGWMIEKVNTAARKIDNKMKDSKNYRYATIWDKPRYSGQLFDNQEEVIFEGHNYYGTNNCDETLKAVYGDYMKLPPEKERVCKHNLICFEKEK